MAGVAPLIRANAAGILAIECQDVKGVEHYIVVVLPPRGVRVMALVELVPPVPPLDADVNSERGSDGDAP